ncbi:MAG: hypothetical protein K0S00_3468, partial [Xanthobacteraceae bacterium]|nr:hypothetical protein [Xanthobacteraceae bacterium]
MMADDMSFPDKSVAELAAGEDRQRMLSHV